MDNSSTIKFIKDEGIVLASRSIGEADKLLTIFTKNFGKLEVLAKNVKKLTSRRTAACDVLSYNKFAIARGKIDTLAEAVNLFQFLEVRQNLPKLALVWQAVEVLNLITPAEVANYAIWQNLLNFLKKLNQITNFHEAQISLSAFEVKLLAQTGWLGKDFKIKNFDNFKHLDKFLTSQFEEIAQKQLKSTEFVKMVLE